MKSTITTLALGLLACAALTAGVSKPAPKRMSSTDWSQIAARCLQPQATEPHLYSSDFRWGYSFEEMKAAFSSTYTSPKRLKGRAYFSKEKGQFVVTDREARGEVLLPTRLIESVRRHIETALRLGYADFVFFPDMGHNHFFIPLEKWKQEYGAFGPQQTVALYTKLLADRDLKMLYHTAEQLAMLEPDSKIPLNDPYVRWRLATRNPIGGNKGNGQLELFKDFKSSANTVRNLEGHYYYSSGINVSANQNGCFPYEVGGVTHYFDLSLNDLEPNPDIPIQDDF